MKPLFSRSLSSTLPLPYDQTSPITTSHSHNLKYTFSPQLWPTVACFFLQPHNDDLWNAPCIDCSLSTYSLALKTGHAHNCQCQFYMHQLLERDRTPTEVCVFCFAFLNICFLNVCLLWKSRHQTILRPCMAHNSGRLTALTPNATASSFS